MTKIGEALQFFRENSWRSILARLNSRDTHPFIQFIKYTICGVGSLTVTTAIFVALSKWGMFPALDSSLPNEVRALNSTYNNLISFFFGNIFAYVTNSLWVFTPGRHHRVLEFIYFTAVSTTGFTIGLLSGPLLIKMYGISTLAAQLLLIVSSTMVNFVCRKFFVFKG
ncbi:GtrA family protein [Prosthecobacter vanneervenii]|uniref:Putative flippase GtrA n=1 Tax=Prosthecobacter vanneervenii TaxID=48466 RepID=A0A7W8DI19_9BACT|nr:GtrA family protein [Prosthecobacter vanneervenii]MBB5030694.1 putative flippase GtrA [Prosthecobacter vanneervenii]